MDAIDFLVKDYELKVNYLSAHFGRMWTRFNFFLTLNSALIGLLLVGDKTTWAANAFYFSLLGALLSIIWWWFGAEDRALVDIYRTASREAAEKVQAVIPGLADHYSGTLEFVGETENTAAHADVQTFRPFGWHSQWISVTRVAALFPLVASLLWLLAAWLLPLPTSIDGALIGAAQDLLGAVALAGNLTVIALGFERTRSQLHRRVPAGRPTQADT